MNTQIEVKAKFNLIPLKQIIENFKSLTCECGKRKQENTAFCGGCYRSLPAKLKNALWRRFGQGFEKAYEEARAHLFGKKELINEP